MTSRCPEGGCSRGEPKNIHIEGCGSIGVIYCSVWQDVSYHPVSKGRDCPFPPAKRPDPHWWEGKEKGEPFKGWTE